MINLSNITLCAISSIRIDETISAINHCKKQCSFKNIIFFSDQDVPYREKISPIKNIHDYNNFIINYLPKALENEEYVLTIHWDGFIVNANSWLSDFLEYDYIGAPWPWIGNICGNGGFCLKSKKFLAAQRDIFSNYENTEKYPEDLILSYYFRKKFLNLGCIYAPPQIAYRFSTEYYNPNFDCKKSFGFHDFKVNPQYKTYLNTKA